MTSLNVHVSTARENELLQLPFVLQTDLPLIFYGAVRFFIDDDVNKLSKAVQMRTCDDVTHLLPVVRQKFSLSEAQMDGLQIAHVTSAGMFRKPKYEFVPQDHGVRTYSPFLSAVIVTSLAAFR